MNMFTYTPSNIHFCPNCLSNSAQLSPTHYLSLNALMRMQEQHISLNALLNKMQAYLSQLSDPHIYKKSKKQVYMILNSKTLSLSENLKYRTLKKRLTLIKALFASLDIPEEDIQHACDEIIKNIKQISIKTAEERIAIRNKISAGRLYYYLKKDVTWIQTYEFRSTNQARLFYQLFEIPLPRYFAALEEKERMAIVKRLVTEKGNNFIKSQHSFRAILHGYYLCNSHNNEKIYIPCPQY